MLDLCNIKLNTLPESFGSACSALKVDLMGNCLTELSPSLSNFHQITELVLMSNLLENIPQSIFSLTSLSVLNLGANKITQIPEALNTLHKLEVLIFSFNRITRFDANCISSLKALHTLSLHNNCIEGKALFVSQFCLFLTFHFSQNFLLN